FQCFDRASPLRNRGIVTPKLLRDDQAELGTIPQSHIMRKGFDAGEIMPIENLEPRWDSQQRGVGSQIVIVEIPPTLRQAEDHVCKPSSLYCLQEAQQSVGSQQTLQIPDRRGNPRRGVNNIESKDDIEAGLFKSL